MAIWVTALAHAASSPSPLPTGGGGTASKGFWDTWGGPAVTAAIVTVVLGSLIQYYFSSIRERGAARRDLQVKSLNEFYAPIMTLLASNLVLRNALRAEFGIADGDEWHMLDHRDQIRANPKANGIVGQVLAINIKIGKILETKSGLDLGRTKSAARWEVHRRLLADALAESPGAVKGELTYFPRAFEDDIIKAHNELVQAVKSSVGIKK